MNHFKRHATIPVIIGFFVLVILLKSWLFQGFRMDASDMLNGWNPDGIFLNIPEPDALAGKTMIVLDYGLTSKIPLPAEWRSVPMDLQDLLDAGNRTMLEDPEQIKIIATDELTTAIQIRSLIRQMGGHPVYILDLGRILKNDPWASNEELRYPFEPDSTIASDTDTRSSGRPGTSLSKRSFPSATAYSGIHKAIIHSEDVLKQKADGIETDHASIKGTHAGITDEKMGLVGFGSDSRFAYAHPTEKPVIMVVDRLTTGLNDGAPYGANGIDYKGSFPYCWKAQFPRIILFEVSGTIDMRDFTDSWSLDMDYGYCWVVFQSAPAPGIEIFGVNLSLASDGPISQPGGKVTDVLITGGTFSYGDLSRNQAKPYDHDPFTVFSGVDNVVIDHCTFRWGTDESFGMGPCGRITVSNCLIYEPLWRSQVQPKYWGGGSFSATFGADYGTFMQNIVAFGYNRNPWYNASQEFNTVRTNRKVTINNLHRNSWIRNGGEMGDAGHDKKTEIITIGNVSYPANDDYDGLPYSRYCGMIRNASASKTRIYALDLLCQFRDANPWINENDPLDSFRCLYQHNGNVIAETVPPFDISDYNPIPAVAVTEYLLNNAGPRYLDAHDRRILEDIRNNTKRNTCPQDNEYPGITSIINSPEALPARTVFWEVDTRGDVQNGYDFERDPQFFSISVSIDGGVSYTAPKSIQLEDKCTNANEVVHLINKALGDDAPDLSSLVRAYLVFPSRSSYRFVAIQTLKRGSLNRIRISGCSPGLVNAIDLHASDKTDLGYEDDAYIGVDAPGGLGYLTREHVVRALNHANGLALPSHPHEVASGYKMLTNLEVWIMNHFPNKRYTGPTSLPTPSAGH
jgi:hypothetical protein